MKLLPVMEKDYPSANLQPGQADFSITQISPDTLKSFKYLLKSAMSLCKARDARLILSDKIHKQHIIGFSKEPLSDTERILAKLNIGGQQSTIFNFGESITTDEKTDVVSDAPYILCKMDLSQNVHARLLLKNKLFAKNFSSDDKILLDTLTGYFLRLWQISLFPDTNSALFLKFSESLSILMDKMDVQKENLEAKQLIGEIIRVSKLINSTLDLQALLESIMESAKLVLKTEGSSLMLIDEKTSELYFNIVSGEKERELKQIRIPIGTGIAGAVVQSMQPQIVNDAQNDSRLFKTVDEKAGFITRNLIACPLMVRNKIIGVLEVINAIGREGFSQDDLDLYKTFSEQAAIAIHNRELITSLQKTNDELNKKVHELSSLHEVSKVLISGINEKELFDSVIKIIAEVLDAERSSLLIYRQQNSQLELVSCKGCEEFVMDPAANSATNHSLANFSFIENRIIRSPDLKDPAISVHRQENRYQSDTCIIFPLVSGSAKFGVLCITDKKNSEDFNDEDYQIVSTIASQITRAIENFQLLEEMIEKKSFERELEITSSIQKSILPKNPVTSPHFDLGYISKPAKIMGGDFYDFESFPKGDFSFLIADVSGKSLPAALFMAITNSIIKTLIQDYRAPGDLIKRANDLVYKNSHSGMFVTLFYLYLDTMERVIRFSSAGHNEQFIYRSKTDEFIFLEARGRPLGVTSTQSHGPFLENSIVYEEDDLVVLYTDGIVEAINENKEQFGIDRFMALVKTLKKKRVQEMADEIFREVTLFAGSEPQFDDFTLLILKMNLVRNS
ncbi:MAG: SpoIIE family protein phosphatase [Spirochaetia bacterium]|nr:SpoIIE family protein phosphatase [Spirochaetia bacterium]